MNDEKRAQQVEQERRPAQAHDEEDERRDEEDAPPARPLPGSLVPRPPHDDESPFTD